jgi:hypothetical protein
MAAAIPSRAGLVTGRSRAAPGLIYATALAWKMREPGRAAAPIRRRTGEEDDHRAIPVRSSTVARRPARRAAQLMIAISAWLRTTRNDPA